MRRVALSTLCVVVLAVVQAGFSWQVRGVDPYRDYLPPPPSPQEQTALSFGDSQFLYRIYALGVQNAGDTGGRIVPVKNYDFGRVIGWLDTLATMDSRSEFAVSMANGYFGLSQNVRDVEPVVRFMMRNVAVDPPKRWRWLIGATYLARFRLKDQALALEAARQMASYDFEGIDIWASLAPAYILEDEQRYAEARDVVETAIRRLGGRMSAEDVSQTEKYLTFLSRVERGEVPPRPPAIPSDR